ncbi:MAG: TetR/AcrR family transcriptional regulator [Clostridia bacterium]|nr:TetR/AcrR family transcriptional regulator [Clostridia bacterium]
MKTNKRNLILDSAERLMFVMPDKDITINLIAKEAEIGKGSIYYYFRSKDEIINAVIERCYKKAIHEYFRAVNNYLTAVEKIKCLFQSMIKKEFHDNQQNFIIALHLNEDILLHNKMKQVAIDEVSPILTEILKQGVAEGSMLTDTPEESAEIIVGVLTFLLDDFSSTIDTHRTYNKLKILANVLETCLRTAEGSFNFLYERV